MFEADHYKHLIELCWKDDVFKNELISNPEKVLKAVGMHPPEGTVVRVVENTITTFTLVIPPQSGKYVIRSFGVG
ncbi:NHLP leader peptide family natural product precursor [Polynucleobacter antarcticus]|uniref:NHLP leader peptide family natural product n=1 Tax=Polynucleobacter antarcticus TaxID=1743162 RepID=A0A6M9PQK4_9BURK|nr:NHLP leader peptide family natural product precursor [Polynucleobacter antarcticus]QKM62162.1 NHLP leader peptide family natural product precursor [Polynucleobacter antarcticus]